ncbi:MAG: hypothetical protein K2Y17_07985 [Qipengyuania sp.]|nr:hypothetical protein [Qipengyuania sp.]
MQLKTTLAAVAALAAFGVASPALAASTPVKAPKASASMPAAHVTESRPAPGKTHKPVHAAAKKTPRKH